MNESEISVKSPNTEKNPKNKNYKNNYYVKMPVLLLSRVKSGEKSSIKILIKWQTFMYVNKSERSERKFS